MTYEYEQQLYPAGWVREVELGRIVYLMPGHNKETSVHPKYQPIV